jgi:phosphotransferase system  glucose/maltose/N-acetylglucosamine-specific IIC component
MLHIYPGTWFANIFSHSVGFIFLMVSFEVQKLYYLIKVQFTNFFFGYLMFLVSYLKRPKVMKKFELDRSKMKKKEKKKQK